MDTIVREVLRRLQSLCPRRSVCRRASPPRPVAEPARDRRELRLNDALVTLARCGRTLAGRAAPGGGSASRDHALGQGFAPQAERGSRASGPPAASCARPSADLVVVVAEMVFDPSQRVVYSGRRPEPLETVAAAVELSIEQVPRPGTAGSAAHRERDAGPLRGESPSRRPRGMGASQELARQAVRTLGPNLLVVDPAGRTLDELAATLRAFTEGGPRECPNNTGGPWKNPKEENESRRCESRKLLAR